MDEESELRTSMPALMLLSSARKRLTTRSTSGCCERHCFSVCWKSFLRQWNSVEAPQLNAISELLTHMC